MIAFVNDYKFIVAFLVGVAFVNVTFGEKATFYFLLLVLFSMILSNQDKFSTFLGGVTRV